MGNAQFVITTDFGSLIIPEGYRLSLRWEQEYKYLRIYNELKNLVMVIETTIIRKIERRNGQEIYTKTV